MVSLERPKEEAASGDAQFDAEGHPIKKKLNPTLQAIMLLTTFAFFLLLLKVVP